MSPPSTCGVLADGGAGLVLDALLAIGQGRGLAAIGRFGAAGFLFGNTLPPRSPTRWLLGTVTNI